MEEYHKLEIQEIFSRTKSLETLRAQFGTFFGTANLTALGFAFTTQKVGILFLAAAIFVVQILMDTFVRRNLVVLYYRGIQLEKKYASEAGESLLHVYTAATLHEINLPHQLLEISTLRDPRERVMRLRKLRPTIGGLWLVVLAGFVEIVMGIILFYQGWGLF
jgi:hypothetical protein